MWQSYVNGLLVALGLIMAIGTQNAFVLAQSLPMCKPASPIIAIATAGPQQQPKIATVASSTQMQRPCPNV